MTHDGYRGRRVPVDDVVRWVNETGGTLRAAADHFGVTLSSLYWALEREGYVVRRYTRLERKEAVR